MHIPMSYLERFKFIKSRVGSHNMHFITCTSSADGPYMERDYN